MEWHSPYREAPAIVAGWRRASGWDGLGCYRGREQARSKETGKPFLVQLPEGHTVRIVV